MILKFPALAARLIGVHPSGSVALGFSDNGANILMILEFLTLAVRLIGVHPSGSLALGFFELIFIMYFSNLVSTHVLKNKTCFRDKPSLDVCFLCFLVAVASRAELRGIMVLD